MKTLMMFVLVCAVALPVQAQQTGWLGVSVQDGKDQGASIQNVESDGPAAKAGLKSGDLIVEYNKTPVSGSVQLTRLIRETPPGRAVEVRIRRDNKDETVQLTTGSVPDHLAGYSLNGPVIDLRDRLDGFRTNIPRIQVMMSYSRSGIHVQDMTSQLRDFFGVTGNDGVLVTAVERNTASEKAGLKAGDVITAVDNHSIRTPYDFSAATATSGKVTLRIVRDKKEMDVVLDRSSETR